MIEVEKKFTLTESDIARLTKDAVFMKEVLMTDAYYDTADFKLTSKNHWLRERNGRFELKIPLTPLSEWKNRLADQYRELETNEEIAKELGLSGDLPAALAKAGYKPFAVIKTVRRKYKHSDFIIDLDVMDFGYTIGEIELMVNSESEMSAAIDKILAFAKQNNLTIAQVRGKVLEYIKRNDPKHYALLISKGMN